MKPLIFPLLAIVIWGCSPQKSDRIPEPFQELDNLTVYSADVKPAETIFFTKDAVYGESDEVIIGRMGDIAVDRLGRVFIADTRNLVIYVFESDGLLAGQLGGEGRGPGEFSSIHYLQIRGDHIYAFDSRLNNRVSVFTLDTLAGEETIALAGNRENYHDLRGSYPLISELFVLNKDTYIATFLSRFNGNISSWEHIEVQGFSYLLDQTGNISRKLMDFKHSVRTIIPYNGVPALEFPLTPFYGTALTVLSNRNRIYFAKPYHFLIKAYNPDGTYERAFYYPHKKIPLTRESAIEDGVPELGTSNPDLFINNIGSINLPESWPVLTDMKIDDQDRLWIATTVEKLDIYEWWVLENTGELITKFEWPRNEPIKVIKNDYMYTRQTDPKTGLQQVVRYRIEMEEV